MTKTPEELTEDWKAGKLEDGLYYILLENRKTLISELETWYRANIKESKEYYETEQAFYGYSDNMISEVLAPVPNYDEYKAMQSELAEHKENCCCVENEVMQLKLAEVAARLFSNEIYYAFPKGLLKKEEIPFGLEP